MQGIFWVVLQKVLLRGLGPDTDNEQIACSCGSVSSYESTRESLRKMYKKNYLDRRT